MNINNLELLKKKVYKDSILLYGWITLLLIMKSNEASENFEECQIIYQVLSEHKKNYNLEIPLKYSEQALDIYQNYFNELGYSGETALNNLPSYVEDIQDRIKHINSLKQHCKV